MLGCVTNINTVSSSIASDLVVGDPAAEFVFDEMTLMVGKETPESLGGSNFTTPHGSVQFPALDTEGASCLDRRVTYICV